MSKIKSISEDLQDTLDAFTEAAGALAQLSAPAAGAQPAATTVQKRPRKPKAPVDLGSHLAQNPPAKIVKPVAKPAATAAPAMSPAAKAAAITPSTPAASAPAAAPATTPVKKPVVSGLHALPAQPAAKAPPPAAPAQPAPAAKAVPPATAPVAKAVKPAPSPLAQAVAQPAAQKPMPTLATAAADRNKAAAKTTSATTTTPAKPNAPKDFPVQGKKIQSKTARHAERAEKVQKMHLARAEQHKKQGNEDQAEYHAAKAKALEGKVKAGARERMTDSQRRKHDNSIGGRLRNFNNKMGTKLARGAVRATGAVVGKAANAAVRLVTANKAKDFAGRADKWVNHRTQDVVRGTGRLAGKAVLGAGKALAKGAEKVNVNHLKKKASAEKANKDTGSTEGKGAKGRAETLRANAATLKKLDKDSADKAKEHGKKKGSDEFNTPATETQKAREAHKNIKFESPKTKVKGDSAASKIKNWASSKKDAVVSKAKDWNAKELAKDKAKELHKGDKATAKADSDAIKATTLAHHKAQADILKAHTASLKRANPGQRDGAMSKHKSIEVSNKEPENNPWQAKDDAPITKVGSKLKGDIKQGIHTAKEAVKNSSLKSAVGKAKGAYTDFKAKRAEKAQAKQDKEDASGESWKKATKAPSIGSKISKAAGEAKDAVKKKLADRSAAKTKAKEDNYGDWKSGTKSKLASKVDDAKDKLHKTTTDLTAKAKAKAGDIVGKAKAKVGELKSTHKQNQVNKAHGEALKGLSKQLADTQKAHEKTQQSAAQEKQKAEAHKFSASSKFDRYHKETQSKLKDFEAKHKETEAKHKADKIVAAAKEKAAKAEKSKTEPAPWGHITKSVAKAAQDRHADVKKGLESLHKGIKGSWKKASGAFKGRKEKMQDAVSKLRGTGKSKEKTDTEKAA